MAYFRCSRVALGWAHIVQILISQAPAQQVVPVDENNIPWGGTGSSSGWKQRRPAPVSQPEVSIVLRLILPAKIEGAYHVGFECNPSTMEHWMNR